MRRLILYIITLMILIQTASATNVALNKPIWQNGTWQANFPPETHYMHPTLLSNIVDGNYNTNSSGNNSTCPNSFACTNYSLTDNHENITIDLGSVYYVESLYHKYTVAGYSYTVTGVNLTTSLDTSTWSEVYDLGTDTNGVVVTLNNTHNVKRYVRYIRASVRTALGNSPFYNYSRIIWYEIAADSFLLYTPANGSTQYYNYPPQTSSINFTWGNEGTAYQIQVAKDSNFNLLSVDRVVSTNYSVESLQGTQQYFWRVATYNSTSGTRGNWSDTSNFLLQANNTVSAGSVQGIVYELISGVQTPISGVSVYIYNATWSSTQVTGSNGYYLFQNLGPSTPTNPYYIQGTKEGYDPSTVQVVNVSGNVVTQDILMKIYISPYVPNFVYEKFIVRGLFENPYPGVTITVYKGSDLTASHTGTTDSAGQIVFKLIKDQKYRITLSGGGISGTLTYNIYAKEESYIITVISGFPTIGDKNTDIYANLTAITVNATHSNLSLIYRDNRSSTSAINFYATNLTTGTTCTQSSSAQTVTLNCTVLAAGTYRFGFNATSSIYGFFQEDKIINFNLGQPSTPAIAVPGVSATLKHWASIMFIVLVASLGSIRKVKFVAVVVPLMAMFFWGAGWLQVNFLFPSTALVIGVLVYMRMSESKVAYQ